jgi:hypothetical protein
VYAITINERLLDSLLMVVNRRAIRPCLLDASSNGSPASTPDHGGVANPEVERLRNILRMAVNLPHLSASCMTCGRPTPKPAHTTGFDNMRVRGLQGTVVNAFCFDLLAASALDSVIKAKTMAPQGRNTAMMSLSGSRLALREDQITRFRTR